MLVGQEDYDRLRPLSYPQTDVFLLGFNVTSPDSFQNVECRWFPEVQHHCPGVPFLIFGTHIDQRENLEIVEKLARLKLQPITSKQGKRLADKLGAVTYVECSALTGEGVKNVFDEVSEFYQLAWLQRFTLSGHCHCVDATTSWTTSCLIVDCKNSRVVSVSERQNTFRCAFTRGTVHPFRVAHGYIRWVCKKSLLLAKGRCAVSKLSSLVSAHLE